MAETIAEKLVNSVDTAADALMEAKIDIQDLRKILEAKLVPGEFPNPNAPIAELRPCGQCDGVFFLDDQLSFDEISDSEMMARAHGSLQRQALRYLRPMSRVWYAHRVHLLQDGTKPTGTSKPEVDFLITPEMRAIAAKYDVPEVGFKRRIRWMFNQEEHCISAVQPQHRRRFRIFPVTHLEPEGIWGVLYI
jgi:hypothetical protein